MLFESDGVLTVGLTGMSGAGKTTACEVFRKNGFFVIDCDKVTRRVQEKGSPALAAIAAAFSADILTEDGSLDRKKLGGIVFSDSEKLKALESIVYPYITYEIFERIYERSRGRERTLVLLDAPTLFESGADALCDLIVSVTADIGRCAQRIMKRDGISRAEAMSRLSSQHPADFYTRRCDISLENSGSLEAFVSALEEAAERIIKRE